MQQPLAEVVQAGKKIQAPQHYSQILVMSLLDPVSQPKYQIKKAFMKETDQSTENTFLFGLLHYQNSSLWQRAGAASLTSNLSSVIRVREMACHRFYH